MKLVFDLRRYAFQEYNNHLLDGLATSTIFSRLLIKERLKLLLFSFIRYSFSVISRIELVITLVISVYCNYKQRIQYQSIIYFILLLTNCY